MFQIPALPAELTIYTVSELRLQWLQIVSDWAKDGEVSQAECLCRIDGAHVAVVDGAGIQLLISLVRLLSSLDVVVQVINASPALINACRLFQLSDYLHLLSEERVAA